MPKDIELDDVIAQDQARIRADAERAIAARDAELKRLRAIEAEGRPEGERAALKRIGDQIRYSPALYPWMQTYAEWITLECKEPPPRAKRIAKARLFARAPVSNGQLVLLEARPDFVGYVRALESGPLERARKQFSDAFPEYVEAHREALNMARDAGDYKAIGALSEPVLDRIMPKKAEGNVAPQVTIQLTVEQAAGVQATYAAPPILVDEVLAEVVDDSAGT